MNRTKFCFLLMIALTQTVYSQTGPGGVGNTGGTSSLHIWLNAESGVFSDAGSTAATDGNTVQQWNDQSGTGNNAATATSSLRPTFRASEINGFPALEFDGSDDLMTITGIDIVSGSTTFIVGRSSRNSATRVAARWFFTGDVATNEGLYIEQNSGTTIQGRYFDGSFSSGIGSVGYTDNSVAVATYNFLAGSGSTFYNLGTASTTAFTAGLTNGAGDFIIGDDGNGTLSTWNGPIAEVIQYDQNVNSAQRIIIENYLAAKYGAGLEENDVYNQDDLGYDYDVAGIGRIDASNLHNDSRGTGMIRILNPTDLGNDEFLMWGHNNGDARATETSDVPAGVAARFVRVWSVSESSSSGTSVDVGSVDIQFDLSEFTSVTATDLVLLIDTDNDGLFDDETGITTATDEGGGIYQFASISGLTDNTLFTIGSADTEQTPLPIELISFEASSTNNNNVLLKWATASETDNSHFTIERSQNGDAFEPLAYVDGAGTTEDIQRYQFTDNNPHGGTSYYRLKQTDFNGQFSYSAVEKVQLTVHEFKAVVYPNPIDLGEELKISLQTDLNHSEFSITLVNPIGKIESTHQFETSQSSDEITLRIGSLSSGIYSVLIREKSGRQVSKRLIIR